MPATLETQKISQLKVSAKDPLEKITWHTSIPFLLVHVCGILAPVLTGFSWAALIACVFFYYLRMFGITAGYHRYFAHRTYRLSRIMQFLMGWLGAMSAQKGPLWWGAYHRHHHRWSDTEKDVHSVKQKGFFWAHVGWVLSQKYAPSRHEWIPDLAKYPELRWLDRYHHIPPFLMAVGVYGLGEVLSVWRPEWGTNGVQMLFWGFFLSTTLLYHGTFSINSLAHLIGRKRFKTGDESRNSFVLSLITMGEGWHNNHHYFPSSERQGLFWWEIDLSHLILKGLEKLRLVRDLRVHPPRVYEEARRLKPAA